MVYTKICQRYQGETYAGALSLKKMFLSSPLLKIVEILREQEISCSTERAQISNLVSGGGHFNIPLMISWPIIATFCKVASFIHSRLVYIAISSVRKYGN